jgi:hypothetical protein
MSTVLIAMGVGVATFVVIKLPDWFPNPNRPYASPIRKKTNNDKWDVEG